MKVKAMIAMDRGLFDLCRGIARAHGVPLDDLVEETLLAAFVGEEAFVPREQDEIDLLSRLYMPDLAMLAERRLKGGILTRDRKTRRRRRRTKKNPT